MSDNVSKKEFVKILAQYIKYIEKKIKAFLIKSSPNLCIKKTNSISRISLK